MLRWLALILFMVIIALAYFRVGLFDADDIRHVADTLKNTLNDSSSTSEASETSEVSSVTPLENPEQKSNQPIRQGMVNTENQQAKYYLDSLLLPPNQPMDALTAKHFVTADQLINLPLPSQQEQILVMLDSPLTQAGLSNKSLPLSANGAVNSHAIINHTATQTFAVKPMDFQPSLSNNTISNPSLSAENQQIRHFTAPIAIGQTIQLRELLDQTNSDTKRIFYIHAVSQKDEQGIWGIIQEGLTETFAHGFHLPEIDNSISAIIPEKADEVLNTKHSSYLGKLLHDKVSTTYIYNYQQGLVGQNPNLIRPGQQLIIVTFTEDELLDIYNQFNHP